MNPDLRTLAAAIVALPGWKWPAGMCVTNADGRLRVWLQANHTSVPGWLPDLTDPATGGALLRMMEQAEPSLELTRSPDEAQQTAPWCALASPDADAWVTGEGATFGEAIARLALKRGGWV